MKYSMVESMIVFFKPVPLEKKHDVVIEGEKNHKKGGGGGV